MEGGQSPGRSEDNKAKGGNKAEQQRRRLIPSVYTGEQASVLETTQATGRAPGGGLRSPCRALEGAQAGGLARGQRRPRTLPRASWPAAPGSASRGQGAPPTGAGAADAVRATSPDHRAAGGSPATAGRVRAGGRARAHRLLEAPGGLLAAPPPRSPFKRAVSPPQIPGGCAGEGAGARPLNHLPSAPASAPPPPFHSVAQHGWSAAEVSRPPRRSSPCAPAPPRLGQRLRSAAPRPRGPSVPRRQHVGRPG